MSGRIRLDDMTDDQLDALYAELDRLRAAERGLGAVLDYVTRHAGHHGLVTHHQVARFLAGVIAQSGWSPPVPDPGPPGHPELALITPEEKT